MDTSSQRVAAALPRMQERTGPELTASDGRKVKLKVPGLKPPVKPRATEQRGSSEPPHDDPRPPIDPNYIGPTA